MSHTRKPIDGVLLIQDHHSGYIQVLPCNTKHPTSEMAAKWTASQWMSNWDVPSEVLTDSGKEFIGIWWENRCALLGAHHLRARVWYHRALPAERAGRILINILRKFLATEKVSGLRFDFAGTRRLSAPGATWSGQVISSPPGPSGGASKTHLLPGGGVPRVHRARSPVLPLLPLFATPRSVHQFAAVAAGAYPLSRPPNAWSPGAPAPPGPCYWLVASGTPLGWRGGCLA